MSALEKSIKPQDSCFYCCFFIYYTSNAMISATKCAKIILGLRIIYGNPFAIDFGHINFKVINRTHAFA